MTKGSTLRGMGDVGSNAESSAICFFGLNLPTTALPGLDEVGGKGINLCRLTHAKFPVPPGFIITTQGYRRFIATAGLGDRIRELAESIDPDDVEGLAATAAKIRGLFGETEMPSALGEPIKQAYGRLSGIGGENASGTASRVAVRSSATAEDLPEASFAGQQDTYLNISGPEAVLTAVRNCWASLWTDRAVAYRAKKKTALEGLAMAVVVQQMVLAEAAGVMFTANPVSGAADEIVINATFGLGEAIVGGHVTPDTIIVAKAADALRVKEVTVAEKTVMTATTETGTTETEITGERRKARVLDDPAAIDLAHIGQRIEAHYGSAQDIEWALADGRFAIVQTRPIQGLQVARDVEIGRVAEIARLTEQTAGQHRAWVVHNLDETLKYPTPLTWDLVGWFMTGSGGYGQMYRDFGYNPTAEVNATGFLDLICGRIYADPMRAAGQFWAGIPMEYNIADILADQTTLERPPGKFNSAKADPAFLVRLPGWVIKVIRAGRIMKKARAQALERFEQEILPPFLDFVAKARNQPLVDMPTTDLLAELDRRKNYVLGQFAAETLKPGFFGGMAQGKVLTLLAQLMGDADGEDLARVLTTGLENDTTVEQNVWLYRVAHGQATLGEFLERFGHRSTGEMELAQPRWREDPSYIERMLDSFRQPTVKDPAQRFAEQVAARKQEEAGLRDRLAEYGGSFLHEKIVAELVDAQKLLPYREVGKHYLMMGYEVIRSAVVELGRRWKLDRDVFFLRYAELARFESDPATLAAEIASRKTRWESAKKLSLPAVIDSAKLDRLGQPEPLDPSLAGKELAARSIASGAATGRARIVFDPQQVTDLGPDYILVCPSTDPGWTPLFVNARGLIVERGGILSHGAIVARDFGIPAVVLENATKLIPDQARITIDGTRGVITRMD